MKLGLASSGGGVLSLRAYELAFLQSLLRHGVRFIVIGGSAIALHGYSYRNRNDLDLVVDPSAENQPARKSAAADLRSQFGHLALVSPRVDVVESLQGVALEEAFRAAVTIECQAGHVPVLALHHIIANKRFMWRQKDIEDLAYLTSCPIEGSGCKRCAGLRWDQPMRCDDLASPAHANADGHSSDTAQGRSPVQATNGSIPPSAH